MSTAHTVQAFDKDLKNIVATISKMGDKALDMLDICNQQIVKPKKSKTEGKEIAESAKKQDRQINKLDFEVQEMATQLIALRQPMGVDLRYATAAMRIANSIERIGDLAKSVASRVAGSVSELDKDIQKQLVELTAKSVEMVEKAIDSFKKRNTELAEEVIELDDVVDDIYMQLTVEVQSQMVQNSKQVKPLSQILFVVKNFERIGDHATTIADSVLYISSGERS